MSEFIFISDFDGTITEKDFYWILLDDYIGQSGIDYYSEWKKTKKIGTEFLNTVFGWHPLTEDQRDEALGKVAIDPKLEAVVEFVESHQGEFHILSAGFSYYIEDALKRRNLSHLHVLTNEGTFRDGCFVMEPDKKSPYYSDVYGINKETVALHYKAAGKKLYFVGDSEPDFWAAQHADVIFAKNELAKLLEDKNIAYHSYKNFGDIYEIMEKLNNNSQLL